MLSTFYSHVVSQCYRTHSCILYAWPFLPNCHIHQHKYNSLLYAPHRHRIPRRLYVHSVLGLSFSTDQDYCFQFELFSGVLPASSYTYSHTRELEHGRRGMTHGGMGKWPYQLSDIRSLSVWAARVLTLVVLWMIGTQVNQNQKLELQLHCV